MRHVAFVVPFRFETSIRFLRATVGLENTAVSLISQDPLERFDPDVVGGLAGFEQVSDALDAAHIIRAVEALSSDVGPVDRLLGVLEQLQVPLAEAREALRLPGLGVDAARCFRDKVLMKDRLHEANLPCARHALIQSDADLRSFLNEVGFPVVLKPPAGAGAVNTFRLDGPEQLTDVMRMVTLHPENPFLAEEFIQGEEYSFDAVNQGGKTVWHSISRYSPGPLDVIQNDWIQWCVVLPRKIDGSEFATIRDVGPRALSVLGLDSGLAHMEWFRRKDGSVAVSEVGARPPGAQFTTLISYAHDTDFYQIWARLSVFDEFDAPTRKYAVGAAYLRGQGLGVVENIQGLDEAQKELGSLVVEVNLPKKGQAKSSSYEGEGYVVLRHEDTDALEAALRHLVGVVKVELA